MMNRTGTLNPAAFPGGAYPRKCPKGYTPILVESFRNHDFSSGHRHEISIRPLPGQGFSVDLLVECANEMRTDFPVGTVFRIDVAPEQKLDGRPHLYSPYQWPFEVVGR